MPRPRNSLRWRGPSQPPVDVSALQNEYVDWEVNVDTARGPIAALRAAVGESWLRRAINPGDEEHPLRTWFRLGGTLSSAASSVNQQFLHLARLAIAVSNLRAAGVNGVEAKVEQLTRTDADQFLSLAHELVTADAHLQRGSSVAFIPEEATRTPDIMLDSAVEVECKRKLNDRSNNKFRYEMYKVLNNQLSKVMRRPGAPSAVAVEAYFTPEPTRPQINALIDGVRQFDGTKAEMRFTSSDGKCEARIILLPGTLRGIPLPANRLDFDQTEAYGEFSPGLYGTGSMSNVIVISAKAHNPVDRVHQIRKSLRSAAGQFSGNAPAVIELDATESGYDLSAAADSEMGTMIMRFMKDNRRVSAVRITVEIFRQLGGKLTLSRATEEWLNPHALHPLPARYWRRSGPEELSSDEPK